MTYTEVYKLKKTAQLDLKTQWVNGARKAGLSARLQMTPQQFTDDYKNTNGFWKRNIEMAKPGNNARWNRLPIHDTFKDSWNTVHNYRLDLYNNTGKLPTFNSWKDVEKVPGLTELQIRAWKRSSPRAYRDFNMASNTASNTRSVIG